MPVIAAKIIKKPRKIRFCEGYQHSVLMSGPQMRLYGNAFTGDPPYALYICLKCASESDDPKVIARLAEYNEIPD